MLRTEETGYDTRHGDTRHGDTRHGDTRQRERGAWRPEQGRPARGRPARRGPSGRLAHRSSAVRPSRARIWVRRLAMVVILALIPIGWSYGSALTAPGGGSAGLRSVEWIRSHGGGGLVAAAENFWYGVNAPPKGGKPPRGYIPRAAKRGSTVLAGAGSALLHTPSGIAYLAPPAPITPIASPPLAGEGNWVPIGQKVDGVPAAYAAYIRPDTVHTSLLTGVAWMDPKLLTAKLFAGNQDPGGTGWPYMAPIPTNLQPRLVAAFNAGFTFQDARGGFYAYGRTGVPLVNGAASFVIYNNGTVNVGAWGSGAFQLGPTTNIAAVRQNLTLIVDNSAPVPGLGSGSYTQWGATVNNKTLVWRSGVGVTASGALLYASGQGLSVSSLANVLVHAGAVRAMEMDINSTWTNFFSFNPAPGQPAQPSNATKLVPNMVRPPARYFEPTARDFIAVFAR